jgi:large subunit ribosomal protein L5
LSLLSESSENDKMIKGAADPKDNDSKVMKRIGIDKVVVNIGVGKSGEPVERAKRALEELTGVKAAARGDKENVRDFGIHKGEAI